MQIQKTNYNPSFQGRARLIGEMAPNIQDAFMKNSAIKNLAQKTKYDIIGLVSARKATKYEIYTEGRDDTLYRLTLKAQKEKASFFDKIAALFHRHSLTRNYHSSATISNVINGINDEVVLKDRLKLK